MSFINMYIATIKQKRYLDIKLGGYYIKLEFNGVVSERFDIVEGNSKDVRNESLIRALEMLKSDKYKILIHIDFAESGDEFNQFINLKKSSRVKKLIDKFNSEIIVFKFKDDVYKNIEEMMLERKSEYREIYDSIQRIENIKDIVEIEHVKRMEKPKISTVKVDSYTSLAEKSFDFKFNGDSKFYPFEKPKSIPKKFNIGVIVGASGTGKSTLLNEFGSEEDIVWNDEISILSHFDSPKDGIEKLTAVGLNSIPSWVKPYNVLSTGEKFRADLARKINSNIVIDEFTSVVDRNVAKATSTAFSKYIKNNNMNNIVIATCHEDIIEWLEPDWIFNTNNGVLYSGERLRRPKIELEIYETKDYEIWNTFKDHHYLSEDLNKSARKFIATWNGELVGFSATLPQPSGTLKNAYRGHRTVILPDFQGLGLGVRFSDAIGQIHIDEGKRYFSKTSHIRMGEYRENSPLWKPTSKNKVRRTDMKYAMGKDSWKVDQNKISYSHEYIGKDY